MAVAWTLQGEAGKGWDATARSMEYYGITAATVRTGSLADDNLAITQSCKAYDFSGFARPTEGQIVKLLRNGTVYFIGEVTKVRSALDSPTSARTTITIQGPWYRLSKTPVYAWYNSIRATAKAGRFCFDKDAYGPRKMDWIGEHIRELFNGYATTPAALKFTTQYLGYADGTNDELLHNQVLDNTNLLQFLQYYLAASPADLAWWKYTATGPVFCMSRFGTNFPTRTLAIGTAGTVTSATIYPRNDLLKPAGAVIKEKYHHRYGGYDSGGWYDATRGDSVTSGDSGAEALTGYSFQVSRPGQPATRTFAQGDSLWFSWTVSGSATNARIATMKYSGSKGFYTSSQITSTPNPPWPGLIAACWAKTPSTAQISNLFAYTNWLAHEGSVSFRQTDPGATVFGGAKVQVTGGPADWETMLAPVLGHDIDLLYGSETISVGPTYGYTLSQCPFLTTTDKAEW